MPVGDLLPYDNGLLNMLDGTTDFLADTIQARLATSGYTPNIATHDFWDDVSANECADGDYSPVALSSKSLAIVSNKVVWDAAQVDYGAAVTITAKYMVVLHWTGVAGTSALLFYVDLETGGGSVSSTNSDFKVDFNASGMYQVDPTP